MPTHTDWTVDLKIEKLDEDQRLVFGKLSVAVDKDGTPVIDSQGDVIPVEEIERAAYEYTEYSRRADAMHNENQCGHLVESYVSTPEKRRLQGGYDTADQSVYWWVGMRVEPEAFDAVKRNSLRAFSIGGRAVREPR